MATNLAVLVAMSFLLPAGAPPRPAKEPLSPYVTIGSLREVAEGKRPCAELEVKFADGNGLHGWTYVSVAAGSASIERTRGKAKESYSGKLKADECVGLAKEIVGAELWKVTSKRDTGVPDETQPEIRFGVTAKGSFGVKLWANEARQEPGFQATQKRLLAIAKRLSNGGVTY